MDNTVAEYKYQAKNDFVIVMEKKSTQSAIIAARDNMYIRGWVQSSGTKDFKFGDYVILPKQASVELEPGVYAIKSEHIIATVKE